jgi:NAD(P)-dependent dehydrogenase (short-subunit alcohol dehydrogenase family)
MSNVLIIGADRGIAAAMANQYRQRGDLVTGVCLSGGEELDSHVKVIANIDVTKDASVSEMVSTLEGLAIDILVHAAGVGAIDRWGKFDFDSMLAHYNLNALGPLRTISALSDNLVEGGKVGIVTSRMGSVGDNGSGGMYSYRMSKAAANMLGVNLYHELKPRGIAVMLLHPGTVATAMTRGARGWEGFTKPSESASGLIAQLDNLGPGTPPEFRHADGTLLPW